MRDKARSPLIPLDFEHVSRGVKREIIIDYDKGEIYVVSPDDATVLINITNRIKESIIDYVNKTSGSQITDISNTYVTVDGIGRVNIAELLKFFNDYGVDAFPAEDLAPIALRKIAYDNASIIISNNKVSVAGFTEAGTDYVPMKKNGTIQWVPATNLPDKNGFTPNKYDIVDTLPIDGLLKLSDNPIQKSIELEGEIGIELPKDISTNYCMIRWIVSITDLPENKITFNDEIHWKYDNDSVLEANHIYIYTFETFDFGSTWYGQRLSFDNDHITDTTVTMQYLYENFFDKNSIRNFVSWEALDDEADSYSNASQFPNVVNIADEETYENGTDISNIVQFKSCTSKTFYSLGIIHTNYLYFLVDTGELYKGPISFTNALVKCREFPDNPTCGKLYYNLVTKEMRYYDVSEREWVSLMTPLVDTLFDESIDYKTVTLTGNAIKEYIDYRINEMYESLGKEPGYNTTPIFNTYELAMDYAKSNPLSKAGQCITAPSADDPTELVMYVIQADKSLKEYPSMEQIKKLISWKSE